MPDMKLPLIHLGNGLLWHFCQTMILTTKDQLTKRYVKYDRRCRRVNYAGIALSNFFKGAFLEDTEAWVDYKIPKENSKVAILLGSANRDPEACIR